MAKALSPAMLRVDGQGEDFIIFDDDSEPRKGQDFNVNETKSDVCDDTTKCNLQPQFSNFTMNTSQWDTLNEFVKACSRMGFHFWAECSAAETVAQWHLGQP